MPRETERRVVALLDSLGLGRRSAMAAPDWLMRPGRRECGDRWPLMSHIYAELTGGALPETMPSRERRSVDAIYETSEGFRIVEIDERQHFNPGRAATLRAYPADVVVAFDRDDWLRRSEAGRFVGSGGWSRACPPLFPEDGGRHLQRAFRDALADLLPDVHGWLPTLRIAEAEVKSWIRASDAAERMAALVAAKFA